MKFRLTNYIRTKKKNKTALIALVTFTVITALYFIFYRITISENTSELKEDRILNAAILENFNGIFWGQNILEKLAPATVCDISPNCRKFENKKNEWLGVADPSNEITIGEEYLLKIKFKNDGGFAGINLVGKFSKDNIQWWKDRKSLNISVKYGYLEINAHSGTSQDPVFIFSEQIQTDQFSFHNIYLEISKNGENLGLYDATGTLIRNFNLETLYPDEFTDPIFPDNKFYIGLSIEPNSTLYLDEFYGMPLKSSATEPDKTSQKAVS